MTREAFRAPMRSRDDGIALGAAVERALAIGVCGIGGLQTPPPRSLSAAVAHEADARGERAARRLERFAAAPLRAFVWTRDIDQNAWLGSIAGDWRYDETPAAAEVDLVHVRPCEWLAEPVPEHEVPPAVRATFARGGRNWQGIRASGTGELSAACWARGARR